MRTAARDRPASSSPGGTARPRRRAAAGLAAVLVSVLAGPALAAPAHAAGPKHQRVEIVTASDGFLVFRQKLATTYSLSFPAGSTLYSIGRTGKRHAIEDFDPQLFPDLEGSTLTQSASPNSRYDADRQYDPAAPEHVRWRDLRSGAHGVREIPAGDDYVGAAPGGWIATRATETVDEAPESTRVMRYTTDGSTSDLGAPFAAGVPWSVRLGPAGVLAVSAEDTEDFSEEGAVGSIRYQSYDAPGRWRTLYEPGPGAKMFCTSPSATHVVCEAYSTATTHSGQVLIALRDGTRRWQDAHPKGCQTTILRARGSSAFGKSSSDTGPCVKGRIEQISAKGVYSRSMRTYGGRGDFVDGLGGFLFVTADQRSILRVTKAGSTPQVVTRAH